MVEEATTSSMDSSQCCKHRDESPYLDVQSVADEIQCRTEQDIRKNFVPIIASKTAVTYKEADVRSKFGPFLLPCPPPLRSAMRPWRPFCRASIPSCRIFTFACIAPCLNASRVVLRYAGAGSVVVTEL